MQLLLQFYVDSCETFRVFYILGPDLKMCILFQYNPQIIFCRFFLQNELTVNILKLRTLKNNCFSRCS